MQSRINLHPPGSVWSSCTKRTHYSACIIPLLPLIHFLGRSFPHSLWGGDKKVKRNMNIQWSEKSERAGERENGTTAVWLWLPCKGARDAPAAAANSSIYQQKRKKERERDSTCCNFQHKISFLLHRWRRRFLLYAPEERRRKLLRFLCSSSPAVVVFVFHIHANYR